MDRKHKILQTVFSMMTRRGYQRQSENLIYYHPERQDSVLVVFNDSDKLNTLCEKLGDQHAIVIVKKKPIKKFPTIEFFTESELIFDIMEHELMPHYRVLSKEEKEALHKRYATDDSSIPRMLSNDPVAKYYGLSPGMILQVQHQGKLSYRIITR